MNKRHSLFLVIPRVIEALCQELGTKTRYILSYLNACVMLIDIISLVVAEPDTVCPHLMLLIGFWKCQLKAKRQIMKPVLS